MLSDSDIFQMVRQYYIYLRLFTSLCPYAVQRCLEDGIVAPILQMRLLSKKKRGLTKKARLEKKQARSQ